MKEAAPRGERAPYAPSASTQSLIGPCVVGFLDNSLAWGVLVKDLIASVFINVDKSHNALDLNLPIKK